jgi:peptide-methionine (R)-S-oxide reductase
MLYLRLFTQGRNQGQTVNIYFLDIGGLMRKLTEEEKRVIINRGTEPPFSGKYNDFFKNGTYICKQCGAPLFRSESKFKSGCGWPSFDEEIKGAIKRLKDEDGIRTEIVCSNCGAHLGHVFEGEGFTLKNTRHCVNSISLDFIPDNR